MTRYRERREAGEYQPEGDPMSETETPPDPQPGTNEPQPAEDDDDEGDQPAK